MAAAQEEPTSEAKDVPDEEGIGDDSSDSRILIGLLRRHKLLSAAGVLLLVVVIAVGIWLLGRDKAPALTEADEILITDFVNTTGDDVFDGALKTALRVKLDESPYLNIVPDTAVQETLKYMERPPETRIDPAIGREICQRRNDKAVMIGEIAQLGNTYLITLNAENCQTGASLAQTQTEATNKDAVLGALDSAATRMRQELGESLASIEKVNTPLWEATTSSLKALKAFARSDEMNSLARFRDAISFAHRAVELDPNFAAAFWGLSINYATMGEVEKARKFAQRAYELRERVNELERLEIEAHYYYVVTEDLDKFVQILEMATRLYPEKRIHNWANLGSVYAYIGQHKKALDCQLRQVSLPGGRNAFRLQILSWWQRNLGRLSEAKSTLEKAIAEGKEVTPIHRDLYRIAFLEGDRVAMESHAAWVEANPDEMGGMEPIQIEEAYISGRLRKARQLLEDFVATLKRQGRDEAEGTLGRYAWWEAVVGNREQARLYAREALGVSLAAKHIWGFSARFAPVALAASGLLDETEEIAAAISEEFPQSTLWHGRDLPAVQANIELWRGNPEKAIALLQPAKRFEFTAASCVLTRGRAYLALELGEEAAAEFHKILDHRGITGRWIEYPAAILGLARAKVLMGDEAGARKSYQDFLAMWKDADPDVPLLQEAKAEYAKLADTAQ